MAKLPFTRRHFTPTLIGVLAGVFILITALVMGLAYLIAQRTQEQIMSNQALDSQASTTPTKRQIRLLTLEGLADSETYEIGLDGIIKIYDQNGVLLKSSLQGLGRITSLFSDLNQFLQTCTQNPPFVPNAYKLTLVTNLGICIVYIPMTGGGSSGDLITGIKDLVDDTFAPTPTMAPTNTPYPGYISPTPTSTTTYPSITSGPTPIGGGPTPTPLPGYLTAPPFECSDYVSSRPFAISNVICGLGE